MTLEADMKKAAYEAMLKARPVAIREIKKVLKNGGTPEEIEKLVMGVYGNNNLTAAATVLAAYHLNENRELLESE